jgi:peptidylprolyl isomerase
MIYPLDIEVIVRRLAPLFTALFLAVGFLVTSTSVSSATTSTLPSVSGSFDQKPTITFPKTSAPTTLVDKVLHQGTGKVVQKKNLVVVNYVGQIWRGKVFDSSFTSQLFGTPIGTGQVISGWDDSIVGKRVGSRLLLVLPPKYAYGSKGSSAAGIKGTDTIVFVIDIVADYNSSVTADRNATSVANSVGGVTVTGSMTAIPKVFVASGTADPKTATITLLNRGHGAEVKPGLVVLQTLVTNWSGATQASTWSLGTPDSETVGQKNAPTLLDAIVGKPIGSRYVALVPKSSGSGPYVVVVNVVAQPHGLKSQPS